MTRTERIYIYVCKRVEENMEWNGKRKMMSKLSVLTPVFGFLFCVPFLFFSFFVMMNILFIFDENLSIAKAAFFLKKVAFFKLDVLEKWHFYPFYVYEFVKDY